jgi:phage baseplate assembly protein gpV
MSDGFYFGGFHNAAPSVYIEVTQEGVVNIQGSVNISGDCTIGGISFLSHIHTGDSGGNTSPPK